MKVLFDIPSDGAILTPSSEDENLPATNIQTPHTSDADVWRTTGNDEFVDIDMGRIITVDSIGLIGNLTEQADITIAASSVPGTDLGINPEFEQQIDASIHPTIFATFPPIAGRFYRVSFRDLSIPMIAIGRLALGAYLKTPGIRPNPKISYHDTSIEQLTIGGQVSGAQGYEYRTFQCSLPNIKQQDKDRLVEWKRTVQRHIPFFIQIWSRDDRQLDYPVYAKIDQNGFTFSYTKAGIYTLGIRLREVF